VREGDGFAGAHEHAQQIGDVARRARVFIETAAAHEFHRVEDASIGEHADVVDGDDAGVFEAREDACFVEHARARVLGHFARAQDLEGHVARELAVVDAEDRSHAAATDRFDGVVLGSRQVGELDRFAQAGDRARGDAAHGSKPPKRSRTSARNSSSLEVTSRTRASSASRNRRRVHAR
jgi:hypothetical protein